MHRVVLTLLDVQQISSLLSAEAVSALHKCF